MLRRQLGMRGLSVITLGNRCFSGPFLAPLWLPQPASGLYAVMVAGWRLLTFRAIHFGQTPGFSAGLLKQHPSYAEWLRIAGTDWNLYVATHEMSFSTDAQREAAAVELHKEYRPEFVQPTAMPEMPSVSAMLLARALRTNLKQE